MKKIVRTMMGIIMCMALLSNAMSVQNNLIYAKAASHQKTAKKKKAALRAYAKFLAQKKYRIQPKKQEYFFSVCDLNGDRIPEMILYNADSIWGIMGCYGYANGKIKKIKGSINIPCFGQLYELPNRKSFAFFRGGPAVEDFMPYAILEHKIKNNKIKLVHTINRREYTSGKNKCYYDRKAFGIKQYKKIEKSMKLIAIHRNTPKNRMKCGMNK